ncbi:MAG TPA: helix-turn-helix transcriptional regulator [Xanthobacteraceae bacterium]|jgi:transcriptional regulator with XRE-family HTH domain|nr:helix-turn-helix transcriptional regulator [Xanthobacteraceae bacterium]
MARRDVHSARRILARNVRRLRLAQELSQEGLAYAAELSQDQISDIENAKHSVTLDNIQRLAFALNVRVADLLDG